MTRLKAMLIVAALLAGGTLPNLANATVYNLTMNYNPAATSCFMHGQLKLCANVQLFPQVIAANAGDAYLVQVNFAQPFYVPGSSTESLIDVFLGDTTATGYGFPSFTDLSVYQTDVQGYQGSPEPNIGPHAPGYASGSYAWSDGYDSFYGFCCGAAPNHGFSVTGVTSTIELWTSDPNPLAYLYVGYIVAVPEPGTWALMLLGLGSIGGVLRTRSGRSRTMRVIAK